MFVVNLTALFKNNKRDHSARSCIAGSPELRKRRRPTKRKRTGSFLTDYSTRKGRIVSQTNAGTVSEAALGKLLIDGGAHMGVSERTDAVLNRRETSLSPNSKCNGLERIRAFPSALIPS